MAIVSKQDEHGGSSFLKRRFRWRLAIAFVLVGAISSGLLAGASFFVVRQFRLQSSLERDLQRAQVNLALAAAVLEEEVTQQDARSLFGSYRRQGDFQAVVEFDDESFSSNASLSLSQIPSSVRQQRGRDVVYQRADVDGVSYLIAGGDVPGSGARAYLFFPEQGLQRSISELGAVLLIGWLLVVVVSGFVGMSLSRRMLRPVARASTAARSLAEGLLDTRLPVDTRDEFGMWAASFNEMAQALQKKISELSLARERERRFTANVAHELRTPVGALVSEASVLREHLDTLPYLAKRPAELLVEDVGRLRELLDDLMELHRLDQGREKLDVSTVDLTEIVRALLGRRGLEPVVSVIAEPTRFRCDRRRLERIAANLIDNALKHGGDNARVVIRRDHDEVILEVCDSGPGIAPEHLPRLFERFFKTDDSRAGTGTGLGLNIAEENARLLGGSIEAQSRLGEGTRFIVRLPVSEGPVVRVDDDGVASDASTVPRDQGFAGPQSVSMRQPI